MIAGVPLETVIAELEAAIPAAMERARVPGLSIALICNAEVVWAQGFGVRDTSTGEPVTPETVFRGCSLSKNLVSYAALKMVENGLLDLDRPLSGYVAEPYLSDRRIHDITLRMVLSHTSGFEPLSTGRGVIMFTPGDRYSYSNNAFRYLQWVMEHVTGRPLADYMSETVLSPLGLYSTTFVWTEDLAARVARGYENGQRQTLYEPAAANAAYGVYTTPTDFARFMTHIMRPDETVAGLREETITAMLSPQSVVAPNTVSWGLGWGLEHTADGDFFWQWGWKDGFRNFAAADRERGIGVVIMTNSDTGIKICEGLAALAVGSEHPAFTFYLEQWIGP
jgi:CubicO group peptidase (beta-lactamase class C family)